ncbi:UNVERIFIED_CONTAM: hypothetical protein PYX00_000432 [Menopon gallinae]|uniref:Uncharacterized protein n=1 Tax=Menopon gallinae TaxID=328185 RepID=A0AAW2I8H6_9NEOP
MIRNACFINFFPTQLRLSTNCNLQIKDLLSRLITVECTPSQSKFTLFGACCSCEPHESLKYQETTRRRTSYVILIIRDLFEG